MPELLHFALSANRVSDTQSVSTAHGASVDLDTSITGNSAAMTPIELLMAAQAACFIKGIERFSSILSFEFDEVRVSIEADRPVDEARISELRFDVVIETSESEDRVRLLEKNLLKHGTIYNVLNASIPITGTIRKSATS
jgi:uncharacterized OsmC-like protein